MPQEIREKSYRHQSQARITKFVRMMVYSYLSVADTMTASLLSKQERAEVANSRIARDAKVLKLIFDPDNSFLTNLRFKSDDELYKHQEIAFSLADSIVVFAIAIDD